EYGEIGEQMAVKFYSKYYDSVKNRNHNDPYNPGFDLECSQPNFPENSLPNIKVEVKAITYDRPCIRLTQTEWKFMVRNKHHYELFIYAHEQGKYHQTIRIKKAWLTLRTILEKLDTQEQSKYPHASKRIEAVIGLQQQESDCKCNDILIHWHRLLRDYSHQDIEKDYR
ncbi:MAG: protein NO VEIN domain-containing protein, partial [Halothece sp.]